MGQEGQRLWQALRHGLRLWQAMGCVCGKPSAIEDSRESPRGRPSAPYPMSRPVLAVAPAKLSSSVERTAATAVMVSSLRREEVVTVRGDGGAVLVMEKRHMSGPIRVNALDGERRERQAYSGHPMRVPGGVPKAMEGEHVVAGWWWLKRGAEAMPGWSRTESDMKTQWIRAGSVQGQTLGSWNRGSFMEEDCVVGPEGRGDRPGDVGGVGQRLWAADGLEQSDDGGDRWLEGPSSELGYRQDAGDGGRLASGDAVLGAVAEHEENIAAGGGVLLGGEGALHGVRGID